MLLLIIGLVLFLGAHSVKVWGAPIRTAAIAKLGDNGFKGVYSLVSLAGIVLIVQGFGPAWTASSNLYVPPAGARHGGTLITLIGMVAFVAAYVPNNHIKARIRHPQFFGTGLWALGHLLSNGRTAEVLLFGGFFAWFAVGFPAAYLRDANTAFPAPKLGMTALAVILGIGLWAAFAFGGLHVWLFGVAPFG